MVTTQTRLPNNFEKSMSLSLKTLAISVGFIVTTLLLAGCHASEQNQSVSNATAVLPKGEFGKSICYDTKVATVESERWQYECRKDLFNLGLSYEKGINGREINNERAVFLYTESSKLGHDGAMVNLGVMYSNGTGVEKNPKIAVEYFEKAANLNNPNGLNNLANRYYRGDTVHQNYKKAFELYKRAALLGHSEAQFMMAKFYSKGWSVSVDDIKSYAWLKIASETNGDRQNEFKELLKEADTLLSNSQVQRATVMAAEIKKDIHPPSKP